MSPQSNNLSNRNGLSTERPPGSDVNTDQFELRDRCGSNTINIISTNGFNCSLKSSNTKREI